MSFFLLLLHIVSNVLYLRVTIFSFVVKVMCRKQNIDPITPIFVFLRRGNMSYQLLQSHKGKRCFDGKTLPVLPMLIGRLPRKEGYVII